MFILKQDDKELYDNEKEEFVTVPGKTYRFLFSLYNLDKWESKHKKRFLDNHDITNEELLDFIKCICLDDLDVNTLSTKDFESIMTYINDSPTATVIPDTGGKSVGRKKILTSEIIYAQMYLSKIDHSWENRNLNKLLVLINTVASLQEPPKKMTKRESMEQQRKLILERRKGTIK